MITWAIIEVTVRPALTILVASFSTKISKPPYRDGMRQEDRHNLSDALETNAYLFSIYFLVYHIPIFSTSQKFHVNIRVFSDSLLKKIIFLPISTRVDFRFHAIVMTKNYYIRDLMMVLLF